MTGDNEQYERYAADARVLAGIGDALQGQSSTVVEIPERLAEAAAAAWIRDENGAPESSETLEQAALRSAAGDLALIGLAIDVRGERGSNGRVLVEISTSLIDAAIRASRTEPAH